MKDTIWYVALCECVEILMDLGTDFFDAFIEVADTYELTEEQIDLFHQACWNRQIGI